MSIPYRKPPTCFVSSPAGNWDAHSSARPGATSPHLGTAGPQRRIILLYPEVRGPKLDAPAAPGARTSPGPAEYPGLGNVHPSPTIGTIQDPSATPAPTNTRFFLLSGDGDPAPSEGLGTVALALSLRVLQASTGCAPSPLGALTRRPSEYSLEEQLVVLGLELAQLYLQLGALAGRII